MPLLGLVLLSPSSLGQNGVSYHVLLSPTVLLLSYTIHRVYGGCTREATLCSLAIFTKHPVSDFQPVHLHCHRAAHCGPVAQCLHLLCCRLKFKLFLSTVLSDSEPCCFGKTRMHLWHTCMNFPRRPSLM